MAQRPDAEEGAAAFAVAAADNSDADFGAVDVETSQGKQEREQEMSLAAL